MVPLFNYLYERDVKELLGGDNYKNLVNAAWEKKIKDSKMYDFAMKLGARIGANHLTSHGGSCDAAEYRTILSEAYESQLCEMDRSEATRLLKTAFNELELPNLLAAGHGKRIDKAKQRNGSGYSDQDSNESEVTSNSSDEKKEMEEALEI